MSTNPHKSARLSRTGDATTHFRRLPYLSALCLLAVSFSQTASSADLSSTLQQAARDVVAHCKANEVKSIGTLKFLVVKDGKFSDSVGPINSLLAKRLEIALILANDPRNPLTLLEDASAVANEIKGASHLSKGNRDKLFSAKYPAMWGDETVAPAAFVTGIAEMSKDLRTLTFSLLLATRTDNSLEPLGSEYSASVTPAILSEAGESFSTRGAFDGGQLVKTGDFPNDLPDGDFDPQTETILTSAQKIRDETDAQHPLTAPSAPVKLEVLYDQRPVPFEVRDGKAFLQEPTAGQSVTITITKDATPKRYGVVVKVNGQNTLGKQQRPDHKCGKWLLLNPNDRVILRGYQINQNEVEMFRVLSKSESKEREVDYGSDVGTLSITVFEQGKPPKLQLDDDAQEADIIETAKLPEEPSVSFGALKAKLLADANRGLIAEGNRVAGQVRIETFHANPIPVMSATAVYYK